MEIPQGFQKGGFARGEIPIIGVVNATVAIVNFAFFVPRKKTFGNPKIPPKRGSS